MNEEKSNIINIYTDGGARGNPGPAAYGVYVSDQSGSKIVGFGRKIGVSTNNIAEYMGVVSALDWVIENKKSMRLEKINFFMDSQLVYSQLTGLYKVKSPHLIDLFFSVKEKEKKLGVKIVYSHIPREMNKNADSFVNKALDEKD